MLKPFFTTIIHDEITLHPCASAHAEHFFWSPLSVMYEYDPTDDGPECETITRILAKHPGGLYKEAQRYEMGVMFESAARIMFGIGWDKIGPNQKTLVVDEVALKFASLGL